MQILGPHPRPTESEHGDQQCGFQQVFLGILMHTSVWELLASENILYLGFPGGTSGKEPTCQCRRHKRHRFNPWVRKILWRRVWQPTPIFLPGECHGQRSLVGYSPKSQTWLKQLIMHTWLVEIYFSKLMCCCRLAELGLCCCAQAFSRFWAWGLLFIVVCRLLIAVVSFVAEHRL